MPFGLFVRPSKLPGDSMLSDASSSGLFDRPDRKWISIFCPVQRLRSACIIGITQQPDRKSTAGQKYFLSGFCPAGLLGGGSRTEKGRTSPPKGAVLFCPPPPRPCQEERKRPAKERKRSGKQQQHLPPIAKPHFAPHKRKLPAVTKTKTEEKFLTRRAARLASRWALLFARRPVGGRCGPPRSPAPHRLSERPHEGWMIHPPLPIARRAPFRTAGW
jgi:hypothetical protein